MKLMAVTITHDLSVLHSFLYLIIHLNIHSLTFISLQYVCRGYFNRVIIVIYSEIYKKFFMCIRNLDFAYDSNLMENIGEREGEKQLAREYCR